MKKLIFAFVILFLPVAVHADETDVLKALEKIKGNVEAGVILKKYQELIVDAKVEINMFKREAKGKENFLKAAESCLAYYSLAKISWRVKNDMSKINNAEGRRLEGESKAAVQDSWKKAEVQLDNAYAACKKIGSVELRRPGQ